MDRGAKLDGPGSERFGAGGAVAVRWRCGGGPVDRRVEHALGRHGRRQRGPMRGPVLDRRGERGLRLLVAHALHADRVVVVAAVARHKAADEGIPLRARREDVGEHRPRRHRLSARGKMQMALGDGHILHTSGGRPATRAGREIPRLRMPPRCPSNLGRRRIRASAARWTQSERRALAQLVLAATVVRCRRRRRTSRVSGPS